jgi:DMSO/TMAO reductase YedYZ molybdopterin-dependent catalytic subunit
MRRRSLIAGAGAAVLAPSSALPQVPGLPPALPDATSQIARFAILPDKTGLLCLTDHPPNYATPTDVFADAITPNDRFFVAYHIDAVPPTPPIDDWRLALDGDAAFKEARLTWDDLADLPQIEVVAVCQAAGNRRGLIVPHVAGVQWTDGAVGCAAWRGPRLSEVLRAVRAKPNALEIWLGGADTPSQPGLPPYRKSLPLSKAMDDDTIIAVTMNGAPLPLLNGYPARLVVPGWVGAYWIKHLNSIQISSVPLGNVWMKAAERVPAGLFPVRLPFTSQATETSVPVTEMVVNSIIADPMEGGEAERSGFTVRGVAWDRGAGIRRVEVSLDDGKTWQDALLDRPLGPYAFRRFRVDTGFMRRGDYRLVSRATNNDGERQAAVLKPNPGGYQNNVPRAIAISVT